MEKMQIRVENLEQDMKEVCGDVKIIMTNHLPHIQADIATLSATVKIVGGLILSGITALIILGLTP